ncbi:S8 family serine peptidase [Streptomyces sp. G-5]|uniref:S8 family serine peptidase n=1 Tax=Streptomyces sp. G-5 TaxID=2977231 RepID=UPI0021D14428|nr:S8 family serine peptidase [Streptomyces sp. G-5]MCU4746658.1 S8 family serine peptidase [Streptomyces sp. G-5]
MTPTRRALATTLALTAALATAPTTASAADTPQHPWYFDTLRVEEMWEHATGEGITVAVIDTGVDPTLPELQGQVLDGTDLVSDQPDGRVDPNGHGTDMAALIAGTGSEGGIRGLAPGASILPVRIGGEVSFFNDSDRLGEGIQYAIDSGAQIINISMGGPLSMDSLDDLIAASARHDILIFAGSGNNGDINNAVTAPAAYDGVIGVGAVDQSGERAAYSTYGEQVALAAPGEGVPGHCAGLSDPPCLRNDGGTSSATALASASAALIWSQHPDWTKNQVLRVMLNTAERPDDQRRDDYTGYGIVRPDRVIIDGEGDPGDPDSPPIFRDWEEGLVPPVTPGPTPETTSDDSAEPAPGPEAEAAATSGNSGSLPWILGGTAAVLVAAVTGWVLYRRRV